MTKWTKEELQLLRENMDATLSKLKILFKDKSEEQIIEKIKLMYRQNPVNQYTKEECDIIIQNKNKTAFDIMKLLPNRSLSSIQFKRYSLVGPVFNKNKYTEKDIETLKKLKEEGYSMHEIASFMDRPLNSIMALAFNKGLVRRNKRIIKWTTEQENIIVSNLKNGKTIEEVVSILNLPFKNVINKALHLGFTYKDILTEHKKLGFRKSTIEKTKEIKELKKEVKRLTKLLN